MWRKNSASIHERKLLVTKFSATRKLFTHLFRNISSNSWNVFVHFGTEIQCSLKFAHSDFSLIDNSYVALADILGQWMRRIFFSTNDTQDSEIWRKNFHKNIAKSRGFRFAKMSELHIINCRRVADVVDGRLLFTLTAIILGQGKRDKPLVLWRQQMHYWN